MYYKTIAAADEVVESIDIDELAKIISINGDAEEEEFEVIALFLIYFPLNDPSCLCLNILKMLSSSLNSKSILS